MPNPAAITPTAASTTPRPLRPWVIRKPATASQANNAASATTRIAAGTWPRIAVAYRATTAASSGSSAMRTPPRRSAPGHRRVRVALHEVDQLHERDGPPRGGDDDDGGSVLLHGPPDQGAAQGGEVGELPRGIVDDQRDHPERDELRAGPGEPAGRQRAYPDLPDLRPGSAHPRRGQFPAGGREPGDERAAQARRDGVQQEREERRVEEREHGQRERRQRRVAVPELARGQAEDQPEEQREDRQRAEGDQDRAAPDRDLPGPRRD